MQHTHLVSERQMSQLLPGCGLYRSNPGEEEIVEDEEEAVIFVEVAAGPGVV